MTLSRIIRRLTVADAVLFRDVRREGLVAHPTYFGEAPEDIDAFPLSEFEERIRESTIFGAFDQDGECQGLAGYRVSPRRKLNHTGDVFGVFVRPANVRQGIGETLM